MENKIIFEESGLKTFALIVLSCYPVHHELNPDAIVYLRGVINGQRKLDCELLLEKLPALKELLLGFAKKGGHEKITGEVAAEFFAGNEHYLKILNEFEEKKLHIVPGSVYSLRTMYAHLVTPVEIVGQDEDGFIGKYVNGQFDFLVKGLTASKNDVATIMNALKNSMPLMVFAHFATVVDVNPPRDFVVQIFEMLNHARYFVSACEYLQAHEGVDYNKFPLNCRVKTQAALKNITL